MISIISKICREIIYGIINDLPLPALPTLEQLEQGIVDTLQDNICPICLEPGDTTGLCNCNSIYHIHCWNQWISYHNTCPTCRTCHRTEYSIEQANREITDTVQPVRPNHTNIMININSPTINEKYQLYCCYMFIVLIVYNFMIIIFIN